MCFFLYLFVCSIAQRTETLAWVRKLLFESLRGEMAQIETTAKMNEMSCETTGFEYIGVEIRVNENANAYVLMCDVFICKMVFLYVCVCVAHGKSNAKTSKLPKRSKIMLCECQIYESIRPGIAFKLNAE